MAIAIVLLGIGALFFLTLTTLIRLLQFVTIIAAMLVGLLMIGVSAASVAIGAIVFFVLYQFIGAGYTGLICAVSIAVTLMVAWRLISRLFRQASLLGYRWGLLKQSPNLDSSVVAITSHHDFFPL